MKVMINPDKLKPLELSFATVQIGKIYHVVEIQNDYFRIVDDKYQPILFPMDIFNVIENHIDNNWVFSLSDGNQFNIVPLELSGQYFFEDYFDGVLECEKIWLNYLKCLGFQ